MKTKNIIRITTICCSLVLLLFYCSCQKKKKMEMKDLDVTLTKSVDSIKINVPATLTFMIMGIADELKAVSAPKCDITGPAGYTAETMIPIAGMATGEYKITKTFTVKGAYNFNFKYMHDGSEMMKACPSITVY